MREIIIGVIIGLFTAGIISGTTYFFTTHQVLNKLGNETENLEKDVNFIKNGFIEGTILFGKEKINLSNKEWDGYDNGRINFISSFKRTPIVVLTECNDSGGWIIMKTDSITPESVAR